MCLFHITLLNNLKTVTYFYNKKNLFHDPIHNQTINIPNSSIEITIKREDLIHPFISGNKFRKLKYNIQQAKVDQSKSILTFGGAFSNHIAAVAFAGKEQGIDTIGIIRGEELALKKELNPTLQFAKSCGMRLKFISREDYRKKTSHEFLDSLRAEFEGFYLLPEGGTNNLAVKGCEEILQSKDSKFNYICCAVGTGGTISGLINASKDYQKILGFPALKGDFLQEDICKFANQDNWELITDYHFGGYGKIKPELISFINTFYKDHDIPLDPIYTGKMLYGIFDLIRLGYFPLGSKILAIHTGGLQGVAGVNAMLKRKKSPFN
ncbi:1-aminocyclopropane-1-carboxylate deaminase/D-cysteine desulfhydrase [Winogradskyella psychrotolerans]|uniref:1-aminocyclopropane-1-carboxylate deaminase/D-cysteine desulfhydrase n=1 Tax=Winogradskyella psychrotolerans TaxID=1344585 RepID=UPI001C06E169|nr:pyridoxal-phosphate dependent enzyme [Winogradskyella psychrotolerans]MBU2929243.1 pyridoxal-phosphate dependent enzyme [Winogradskyella psychrotolerans]